MKELYTTLNSTFAIIINWFIFLLGGYDNLLFTLILFVLIDYITFVMCAISNHNLSIETNIKFLYRKFLTFILVGVANTLDGQIIKTNHYLRTSLIFFYISIEGMSLLRNAEVLGVPIPKKLRIILKQLYDYAEGEDI